MAVHYYAQHQLDALNPARTVLEEMEAVAPESTHTRLRTILGAFLFSGDSVEKKVAVLSGGEKARLALARMLVRPAALLCLDEPTNHLDLAAREQLEAVLSGFGGTLLFISHDRYFVDKLASELWPSRRPIPGGEAGTGIFLTVLLPWRLGALAFHCLTLSRRDAKPQRI